MTWGSIYEAAYIVATKSNEGSAIYLTVPFTNLIATSNLPTSNESDFLTGVFRSVTSANLALVTPTWAVLDVEQTSVPDMRGFESWFLLKNKTRMHTSITHTRTCFLMRSTRVPCWILRSWLKYCTTSFGTVWRDKIFRKWSATVQSFQQYLTRCHVDAANMLFHWWGVTIEHNCVGEVQVSLRLPCQEVLMGSHRLQTVRFLSDGYLPTLVLLASFSIQALMLRSAAAARYHGLHVFEVKARRKLFSVVHDVNPEWVKHGLLSILMALLELKTRQ